MVEQELHLPHEKLNFDETQVIALLVRDPEIFKQYGHLVDENSFELEYYRNFFSIAKEFYKKYPEEALTSEVLKMEVCRFLDKLRGRMTEETLQEGLESHFEGIEKVFSTPITKTYAVDRLVEWAQHRDIELMFIKHMGLLKGGKVDEVLDLTESRTKEIKELRRRLNIWEMLPTANDVNEDSSQDWIVDRIIPARSIIILHGKGGLGKSHLVFTLGNCVAEGEEFLRCRTRQSPVYYVDFENPEPVRAGFKRKLGGSSMRIFPLELKPPKLDSKKEWEIYKSFPPGLFIFDSLRASHSLDSNSDKDMTLIMNRLKDLWAVGHTIILLQHTPRADDRRSKGSTTITDLADLNLALFQVEQPGDEPREDDSGDSDPNRVKILYFGSLPESKSRYTKYQTYIRFDPNAEQRDEVVSIINPSKPMLEKMYDVLVRQIDSVKSMFPNRDITGLEYPNKEAFAGLVRNHLQIGIVRSKRLIEMGVGDYWGRDNVKALPGSRRQLHIYYFPHKRRSNKGTVD